MKYNKKDEAYRIVVELCEKYGFTLTEGRKLSEEEQREIAVTHQEVSEFLKTVKKSKERARQIHFVARGRLEREVA